MNEEKTKNYCFNDCFSAMNKKQSKKFDKKSFGSLRDSNPIPKACKKMHNTGGKWIAC